MHADHDCSIEVQKIYMACYGRPASPDGLDFWARHLEANGGDLSAITEALGTSAEFHALNRKLSDEAFINNLYLRLFGRDADAQGLNFYLAMLRSNERSLGRTALDVFNGARNEDEIIVRNKLAFSDAFTFWVRIKNKRYDEVTASSVKAMLNTVGSDHKSLIRDLAGLEERVHRMDTDVGVMVNEERGGSSGNLATADDFVIEICENKVCKLRLTDAAEIVRHPGRPARV